MKLNQRGMSMLAAVIITAGVLYISVKNTSILLPSVNNEKNETAAYIQLSALINGMIDFTSYAIEQRWCLSPAMTRDISCNESDGPQEYFGHEGNLEQFLLTAKTKDQIALPDKFNFKVDDNPVIDMTVDLDFREGHPLKLVASDRIRACFKNANLKIYKDNHSSRKKEGDEAFIWIEVTLNKKLEILTNYCKSFVDEPFGKALKIFTPRTLNTYALILSHDMDLKDFRSPKTGAGLKFHSPIYVGGDLDVGANQEGQYSNVAFLEKVNLEGSMFSGDEPYQPHDFGGIGNQFQNEYKQFAGLLRGINLEVEADPGLKAIFDPNAQLPDSSNMMKCAAFANLKIDESKTEESSVFIRRKNGNDYNLSLSKGNYFITTDVNQSELRNTFGNGSGIDVSIQSNGGNKAIMEFKLSSNNSPGDLIEWTQGKSSTASVKLDLDSSTRQDLDRVTAGIGRGDQAHTYISRVKRNRINEERSFKDRYDELRNRCSALGSYRHPDCRQVNRNGGNRTNCNALGGGDDDDDGGGGDPADCQQKLAAVDSKMPDFVAARNDMRAKMLPAVGNAPRLTVKTTRAESPNRVDVELSFSNRTKFESEYFKRKYQAQMGGFNLDTIAYDVMFNQQNGTVEGTAGKKFRDSNLGPNRPDKPNRISWRVTNNNGNGVLDMRIRSQNGPQINSNEQVMRTLLQGEQPEVPNDDDIPEDVAEFEEECENGVSEAIALTDWDISFTESTRFSWLFKTSAPGTAVEDPTPDPVPEVILSDFANMSEITPSTFANKCVIPANTTWVFGMYTCEQMVIESRSTPLTIIGTFITKTLDIAPAAISAGIDWYNIWHPDALPTFYESGKLKMSGRTGSTDCKTLMVQTADINGYPMWHPEPPMAFADEMVKCSPAKFIWEAPLDNFLWTTVDPERGLAPDGYATSAKVVNRYRRFNTYDGVRNVVVK